MAVELYLNDIKDRLHSVLRYVNEEVRLIEAYLFGSQITGEADEWSDIDIAVFCQGIEDWKIQKEVEVSIEIMSQFGDDIDVHFFPISELENPSPASFAQYIIKHGLRLDF